MSSGQDFTLSDFLDQMRQLRSMGSVTKMLGMLPGMGDMKKQIANVDEREIDRVEAIISSMTPAEREDPKILNGSRRARIARGSGTTPADVNRLLNQFKDARKLMQAMTSGKGAGGIMRMLGM